MGMTANCVHYTIILCILWQESINRWPTIPQISASRTTILHHNILNTKKETTVYALEIKLLAWEMNQNMT